MKKYFNIVLLVFLATSLSSCLKDNYNALDPENSPSVVEFKNPGPISSISPAGALYSLYTQSVAASPAVKVTYTVQLSGANPASQDITINVGADPGAVAKFNTDSKLKNPTFVNYDLLDASLYSFPKSSYVIAKGQRSVDIEVSYNADKFDFSKKYAFPLAITSTSFGKVSTNFGTILINITGKNAYDGIYKVTNITFNNVLSPTHTAATPRTRYLTTKNLNESYLYDSGISGVFYGISFLNAGASSYYGNFSPVFTFAADGKVTAVTNYYGSANASNRDAIIDPTGVNKMTVTGNTKVMEVSYIMVQNGVNTLFLKEKWEYTGPRP